MQGKLHGGPTDTTGPDNTTTFKRVSGAEVAPFATGGPECLEPGDSIGTRVLWPIRPGDTMFFPIGVVAARLGVPITWMREEADAKRIPYLDVGSSRLFNPYAVARALLDRAEYHKTRA